LKFENRKEKISPVSIRYFFSNRRIKIFNVEIFFSHSGKSIKTLEIEVNCFGEMKAFVPLSFHGKVH
jgi:hypothetical protein